MGKRILVIEPMYHLQHVPWSEERMMKSTLPDRGNKVPQVRVGLGDIQALLSMLTGYLT